MFENIIHHVGVHVAQHPKEAMATAMVAGKVLAPFAIAALPCLVGTAAIGGLIYGLSKLG